MPIVMRPVLRQTRVRKKSEEEEEGAAAVGVRTVAVMDSAG
jgi:hypothetical protein